MRLSWTAPFLASLGISHEAASDGDWGMEGLRWLAHMSGTWLGTAKRLGSVGMLRWLGHSPH